VETSRSSLSAASRLPERAGEIHASMQIKRMMVLAAPRTDATLPESLAHRARSASVPRLSADLVGGIAVVSASLLWRPAWWAVLSSAALCFAAFGGWGLADRARSSIAPLASNRAQQMLHWICRAIAALGALGAAALLYTIWAIALGTWIS
jgi:hypothetical protein